MKIFHVPLAILAISTVTSAHEAPRNSMPQTKLSFGDRVENPFSQRASGHFTIQVVTSFSTQKAGESAVQTVAAPSFGEVFKSQYSLKNSGAAPRLTAIERRLGQENTSYKNLSLPRRAQALKDYVAKSYDVKVPADAVLADLAIEQIKAHPSQIERITSQVKSHLSLGQKVQIASHFGRLFGADYNYDRLGSKKPKGYVSLEELVEAISTSQSGGVCRDISLAQGQLLNLLGVPSENIFTMAYQTPTGQHAVLVVQSPDSDQIIKLNYGKVMVSEKAGSSGLKIDGNLQSSGIEYRFYDVAGKPVQVQSSPLGRLLKDLTGSEPVFKDSLKPYDVSRIIMSTRWGDAAIFTGELQDSGDKVTGFAFDSIDIANLLGPNTEVGVAFINRYSDDKDNKLDQSGFFVNLRTMREKDFLIGPVVATAQVGAETQMAVLQTAIRVDGKSQSKTNGDFSSSVFTAANLRYKDFETGVKAVGYTDFQHVAEAHSGGYTLNVNHIRTHVGVSRKLRGNVVAKGRATLTVRDVGKTLNFEASVQNLNKSYAVNYQKPLDEIPYFFDGSTEVVRVQSKSTKSLGGKKSRSRYIDLGYDRDQKETQVEAGWTLRW